LFIIPNQNQKWAQLLSKKGNRKPFFSFFSVRTRVQGFVFPAPAENATNTTPETAQRIQRSTASREVGNTVMTHRNKQALLEGTGGEERGEEKGNGQRRRGTGRREVLLDNQQVENQQTTVRNNSNLALVYAESAVKPEGSSLAAEAAFWPKGALPGCLGYATAGPRRARRYSQLVTATSALHSRHPAAATAFPPQKGEGSRTEQGRALPVPGQSSRTRPKGTGASRRSLPPHPPPPAASGS